MLVAVFLLLHLPFLPPSLEDLDSINFALGLRDFDVAAHQPHPPGYPLYILAGKLAHQVVPSEAHALAVLSIVAGAASLFALVALYRRIDGDRPGRWSMPAAAVAASAPLFWFTAARPLSDSVGLAAAVGIQAMTLGVRSGEGLAVAAGLAGLATGIRSQVLWLTVPLIALMVLRRPRPYRVEDALVALGALIAGGLVWFVPLVWLSGGPVAYWRALDAQGTEDLTGVAMLWTTHTPRQVLVALTSTFVAPWATPVLAGVVLVAAAAGALAMARRSRGALAIMAAAFGPYLIFDLLFQESVTTRYALPLVVPLAYFAVRGADLLGPRLAPMLTAGIGASGLVIGVMSVSAYAARPAPAFRLLSDMRRASPTLGAPPVFATHRREALDLRRPIDWVGADMTPFSQRNPAPPKHEWLEVVNYWNLGGRAPVWFVADPLRSDLALIDHGDPVQYRWGLTFPLLLGGVRPSEMDWYTIESPAWYLGGGWALTPETGGVAREDHRGPSRAPIEGWVRRDSRPVTLMIGGRNLAAQGDGFVRLSIDGRTVLERTVSPGFFLAFATLQPPALDGPGDYARVVVESRGDMAIEQFDAQNPDRPVLGYGDGWYELEYDPRIGRTWRWMSDRGELHLRAAGQPLILELEGVTETFSSPSTIVIRVGDQVILRQPAGERFSVRATIPASLLTGVEQVVTVETDQTWVPAERSSRTADRRRLGLKVFTCRVTP
jgi:hypothetical protein